MRLIGILVLIIGVALAGGALYYSKQYFAELEARNKQTGPQTVKVVVARTALEYGNELDKRSLSVIDWPKGSVPPGSFREVSQLVDEKDGQKRFVLRAIEPGEPILESKVTGFGEGNRVALRLAEGRRAFTIQIDAVTGVAGFIAPGDRVDIILTEQSDGQLNSRVILQGILVLATDQQQSTDVMNARIARTATVEVDARQAQILALAQQLGRLSLTLRGLVEGAESNEAKPVTADEVMGREKVQEDPGRTIRLRKGGSEVSDVPIQ